MKNSVLCLGNIAYDLIAKNKSDSTPSHFDAYPGGSVFNTALLLAKLECSVAVLAKTGNDFLGNKLIDIMKKGNINTRYVFQEKDMKTALAVANISPGGNSSYLFYRPEKYGLPLKNKKIPDALFKRAKAFHTGSAFTYKDETYKDALFFIKKAKSHNVLVTYDPNWRANRIKYVNKARKRIMKILEYSDLLKLSDTDALGITGSKTLEKAIKKLPANTIVTLGNKGAFHVKDKEKYFIPVFKIKIADTIGAGDAFTAGLLSEYISKGPDCFEKNMKKTMVFASACAALVCTKPGATFGIKDIRQIKHFISTARTLAPAKNKFKVKSKPQTVRPK